MSTIIIRPFKSSDLHAIIKLFKEAVAAINIRHYTPEQIAIWTDIDPARWQTKFAENIVFVAEINSTIAGFADMSREGELDHLYIKIIKREWYHCVFLKQ
jgi:putative acetyltransferase